MSTLNRIRTLGIIILRSGTWNKVIIGVVIVAVIVAVAIHLGK